jgi:hypothetical protein
MNQSMLDTGHRLPDIGPVLRARKMRAPADLRAAVPLDRIDYADAFRVAPTTGSHSAEAWLRAASEDAPAPLRYGVLAIWLALGAQLAPRPSPGHVFGCPLDEIRPDLARLSVVWRIGLRATIVAHAAPNETVVGTFVQLDNRASRAVWRAVTPIHEAAAVVLLSLAARRLAAAQPV